MTTLSAILLLVVIMDPVGNVACFISALRPVPPGRRLRVIARELLFALAILVLFLFGGRWLLGALDLREEALFMSGGIVLFLIALKMIFPSLLPAREEAGTEPFIVPLAMPLVAGPGVIATLMVLVNSQPETQGKWFVALLSAWGITAAVLLCAPAIAHVLKDRGILAVERLMGMLLVLVSVQMFLNGLESFFKHQSL